MDKEKNQHKKSTSGVFSRGFLTTGKKTIHVKGQR